MKAKMYAIAIKHGKKTIDEVPEDLREAVEALLAEG
jgi:hypothetical protein